MKCEQITATVLTHCCTNFCCTGESVSVYSNDMLVVADLCVETDHILYH